MKRETGDDAMSRFRLHEGNGIPFFSGAKDGIPIGLGYFAVSFSLGIAAQGAGLSPFQAFLSSFLCSASAGQSSFIQFSVSRFKRWQGAPEERTAVPVHPEHWLD